MIVATRNNEAYSRSMSAENLSMSSITLYTPPAL
jgi:hypothetical protein